MAEAFAVFSYDDRSLTFYKRDVVPSAGSTFEGKTVTNVYTGIETAEYGSWEAPWLLDGYPVTSVKFADVISPVSTAYWFEESYDLVSFDQTNLDTSKVTTMSNMFCSCESLLTLDVSKFDTRCVTDMSAMFKDCKALSVLDVSGFNTKNVTTMSTMFSGCLALKSVDISSFDTSSVSVVTNMFFNCEQLKTIHASKLWSTASLSSTTKSVFKNCYELVGGNGTKFSSSNITSAYACIDTPETPGYFTFKEQEQMLIYRTTLNDIAEAIRSKTGSTDSLTPGQMVEAVNGFSGGPIVGTVETTATSNVIEIPVDKLYGHAILFPLLLFIDSTEREANSTFNIISMTRELRWGASTSNPVHYMGATLTEGGFDDSTFEDDENALCVNSVTAYESYGELIQFTDTTIRIGAQNPFAPGKYGYVAW